MTEHHEGGVAAADRLEELVRTGRDRWRHDGGDLGAQIEPRAHRASSSPEIQERALSQMRAMVDQLREQPHRTAEVESALRDTSGRLKYGVTKLETEVDRLSQEVSRLTGLGAKPAERTSDGHESRPETQADVRPADPGECVLQPSGRPLTVTLAGVPSFEALMELQRGLTGLQQAMGVSVTEYEDGVAKLELELRTAANARQIAGALRSAIGRSVVVETADGEAHSVLLTLVERGRAPGRPMESRLRPDLWPKA